MLERFGGYKSVLNAVNEIVLLSALFNPMCRSRVTEKKNKLCILFTAALAPLGQVEVEPWPAQEKERSRGKKERRENGGLSGKTSLK